MVHIAEAHYQQSADQYHNLLPQPQRRTFDIAFESNQISLYLDNADRRHNS